MASRPLSEDPTPERLLVTELAGVSTNGHHKGSSLAMNGHSVNGRGEPNGASTDSPPLAPRPVPRNELPSEFDLREILSLLWRFKWAAMVVAFLTASATIAYVEFVWKQEATASAELRHQGEPHLPAGELLLRTQRDNLTADTLTMRSPANFEILAKIVQALDDLPPERRELNREPRQEGEISGEEALEELEAAGTHPFGPAPEEMFLSPSDSFRNWLVLDFTSGRAIEPGQIDQQVDSFQGNLLLIRPDDHRLLLESYWGVNEPTRHRIRELIEAPSRLASAVSTSSNSDTKTIRVRVTHPDPEVAVFFANALPVAFNSFSQRKTQVRRSLAVGIAESSMRRSRQEWINAHQELDEEVKRVNERLTQRATVVNVAGLEPEEVARMIGELNHELVMLEWRQHVLADQRIEVEREKLELIEDGWIDPASDEIAWLREKSRALLEGGGHPNRAGEYRDVADRIATLQSRHSERAERIEEAGEALREICDRISALEINDPMREELQEEFDARRAAYEKVTAEVLLSPEAQSATAELRRESRQLRRSSMELERKLSMTRERLAELNVQRNMLVEENRTIQQRQAQVQALFDRMIRSANLLQEAQLSLASDTSHQFDWQQTASEELVSHSTPTTILLSGLLLSVMLGLGTVMVLHHLDHRIVTTAQLARLTNLPVLGRIPRLKRRDVQHLIRKAEPETVRASQFHPAVSTLAFNLSHALQRPLNGIVCLVTSSVPAEGKSLVSRKLAALYAAKGLRACLLLADCHRVSPDSLALIKEQPGSSEGMISLCNEYTETGREPDWGRCIQKTNIPKLSIAAPGEQDVDSNTLFESAGFAAFIQALRRRFDVVVIDSPPVTLSTDPMTLGRVVDVSLLVVRAGVSEMERVSTMLNQVQFVNMPVAGIVLNDIRREGRYGYGYYGYYGYAGRNGSRSGMPAVLDAQEPAPANGASARTRAVSDSTRQVAAIDSQRQSLDTSATASSPSHPPHGTA